MKKAPYFTATVRFEGLDTPAIVTMIGCDPEGTVEGI
jgi:hypothetical protein